MSRIVLLHATPVAMQPVHTAFEAHWPEAETVNLLDDGLTIDRARETELSEKMIDRFVNFGLYGKAMDADGILVTCSAFGPAIDKLAATAGIPVLKPNEAMFREALALGTRIGMLATFGPSVKTMTDEFDEYVRESGVAATLRTIVVDRAIDLLRKGDVETHNRLVAERAPELADCDAIMLAHFSTSRAAAAVRATTSVPVLTAPDAAVSRMKALLQSR
ncbi:aspartate/glutamate racemase family protein [Paraburkholderia sp. Ac-20347]|jgi:Asp/Glu/hydantoin racemase|uniref:aspartate/glutamate racemase family protein n=1 Tax=Paraburkholderia sp. Ac-20347 TaxID=2703892 RepID=UPI00197EDD26|nr:aspartate/glutamate racemase family protein [Paraburkholderia sp. Ac-20347]MBN3809049.1 aspartate/glutamate racemase family protein [Paraburkholderia sp. Ac-20347]